MNEGKQEISYVILGVECILLILLLCIFEKVMSPYLLEQYMPVRVEWLNKYIEEVSRGVFPQIIPSGNSDHAIGIYILGANLGNFFHIDGSATFRLITLVTFYFTIIIFPILIQKIFRCRLATYIAPISLCFFFNDYLLTVYNDVYVGLGICMVVLSVPLIIILIECQIHRRKILLYFILIMVMSVANIAREHTSLGLLIVLLYLIIAEIIKAVKGKEWVYLMEYICIGFLMLISYNLCATIIPNALLRMNGQEQWLTSSTAWHNIYIGFGYFDNPYDLVYLDECAYAKVKEINANALCPSNEYFDICKALVIDLFKKDWIFCVKTAILKTIYIFREMLVVTLRRISRVICIIFIVYNVYKKKMRDGVFFVYTKQIIIVGSIFILIGAIPSILTAPSIAYSITAYAAIQIMIMMTMFSILAEKQRKNCELK